MAKYAEVENKKEEIWEYFNSAQNLANNIGPYSSLILGFNEKFGDEEFPSKLFRPKIEQVAAEIGFKLPPLSKKTHIRSNWFNRGYLERKLTSNQCLNLGYVYRLNKDAIKVAQQHQEIKKINSEIEKGKKVKEILKDIQGKKFWERLNTVVTPERDADWIYRLILGIYGRSGGKELTERDYKVFFKKSYLNDVVPLRGRPGYYQYIYSRRKVFVDNPIPGERNHFNDTYGIRPWGMPTWFRRGYLEESRTLISTLKTSCRYRIKKEAAEVARKYLNIEESLDEIVEYFSQETKEKPLSLNSFVKTQ